MNATITSLRTFAGHLRYRPTVISGLAAAAAVLLAAAGADAIDRKIYPGTLCVAQGPSSDVEYRSDGSVRNPNGTARAVLCPIARDSTERRLSEVRVLVRDNTGAAGVECALRASSPTSGSASNLALGSSVNTGTQSIVLDDLHLVAVTNNAALFLRCTIPGIPLGGGPSEIVHYRVEELT